MTTSTTITFDTIGSDPQVAIPNGYEGFNWTAYEPESETFAGSVYAATGGKALTSGTHSVKGFGFQMEQANGGVFDAISAVIAADSGFGDGGAAMDVTVVGRLNGAEVQSLLLNGSTGYGQGPVQVDINFTGIDQLQLIASAMESFDVDNIVVAIP